MIATTAQTDVLEGRTAVNRRFTLDGSDELEWRLAFLCEKARSGVRTIIPYDKIESIMLGGGYGRGEGGVMQTEAGDQPYNDMEFYVLVRGNRFLNRRLYDGRLHHLAEKLSNDAGVEVEFKIISLAELRHSPASMFYYDLVVGHRLLFGNEGLLNGCRHHRSATRIPLSEATRLMMNRCTGLLFAREKLRNETLTAEDADFIGRNLAKVRLAFGDAVLTAFGRYHWSCLERHNRLIRLSVPDSLPWMSEVRRQHLDGVKFKLHPTRTVNESSILKAQADELTGLGLKIWLWIESRRLGRSFSSASDYVHSDVDKCPETHFLRNCLIIARSLGPHKVFEPGSGSHPRQRVFHALALLLWDQSASHESRKLGDLQRELCTVKSDRKDLMTAFRAMWERFR